MELMDALTAMNELLEGKPHIRGRVWVERSELMELIDIAVTKASQSANSRLEINAHAERVLEEARIKADEILSLSNDQATEIIRSAKITAADIVDSAENEANEILSEDNRMKQILDLQEKIQLSSQTHLDHVSNVQADAISALLRISEYIREQARGLDQHTDSLIESDPRLRPNYPEETKQFETREHDIGHDLTETAVETIESVEPELSIVGAGENTKSLTESVVVAEITAQVTAEESGEPESLNDSQLPFISDELFQPYDSYEEPER